jgi:hypothetical protein
VNRCAFRPPPLPVPLRFFWRKALTKTNICATMNLRVPSGRTRCAPPRGPYARCPRVAKNLSRKAGVLFLPALPSVFRKAAAGPPAGPPLRPSDFPADYIP